MDWRDLVAGWEKDPEFREVYRQNYPYHAVADAVVQLRGQLGLTQGELAKRAGTTQSVIARLESGKQAIRVELLNRIAAALDMDWRPVFEPRTKSAMVANTADLELPWVYPATVFAIEAVRTKIVSQVAALTDAGYVLVTEASLARALALAEVGCWANRPIHGAEQDAEVHGRDAAAIMGRLRE